EAKKSRILLSLLLLTVFIPFIVWEQSFGGDKLSRSLASIGYEGEGRALISSLQWLAVLLIAVAAAYLFRRLYSQQPNSLVSVSHQDVFSMFVIVSGVYTLYSIMITLAFMSTYRIEQYLYVVNYAVIYLYIGKIEPTWAYRGLQMRKWSVLMVMILIALAVMTWVAINSHGEMPGAHRRFE